MDAAAHSELLNTLLALAAISLASLIGSISFAFGKRLQAVLPYLLAVASGVLFSAAAMHLIPDAMLYFQSWRRVGGLFVAGLLGSFLLERAVSFFAGGHMHDPLPEKTLAWSVLASGAAHSFVDGVAIAVAFTVGHSVGVATTSAVFLHEVPHHIADVGVLIYAGMSRGRATSLNLVATSGCAAGGAVVLLLGLKSTSFTFAVLPIVAANFVYIGCAIMLPSLQRKADSWRLLWQAACFLAAAGGMTALHYWEPV